MGAESRRIYYLVYGSGPDCVEPYGRVTDTFGSLLRRHRVAAVKKLATLDELGHSLGVR